MTPHPDYPRLMRAVDRLVLKAGSWKGHMFRFATPRWATAAELLTGEGALMHGGRWHPIGRFCAVYASLTPETALAEALAHVKRFKADIFGAMPKTINAIDARLRKILDLTDGPTRQRLGVSWGRMMKERWWELESKGREALTQAVGRAAYELGLEGILVPSAADASGENIVYFPDNKRTTSTLTIVNAHDLPTRFF